MWQAFLIIPSAYELADFATLLLSMSVNQAGLERSFSDLKIKKTRLRNRMKLPRLEKMAKVGGLVMETQNIIGAHVYVDFQVGADIRSSQKEAGLVEERKKRKNHEGKKVAELLKVPRYADVLEKYVDTNEDGDGSSRRPQSALVRSREGWRKEMARWVQEEQARSEDSDEGEELLNIAYGRQRSKWLPRSLELLFGGRKELDIDEQLRRTRRRQAYTEEAQLMELLVDEEADDERIPDDGELEGSGDDFEG